jgi:Acyl-CoA dehydrogenases
MSYVPPVSEIDFSLNHIAGFGALIDNGLYGDLDRDTAAAILEEAGRFAAEELVPLNWQGDQQGATLHNGEVKLPDGWQDAYRKWREGGWASLTGPVEFGGQDLPHVLALAVNEIWNAANMAFGLCPLLTQGAVDALAAHGSDELKRLFLPKMVSGEWTGTMHLTEPHAGSDLRFLKTRAVPAGDGTFRLTGTKIYITYGEHPMTENIIHLVLARLPDAPAGTRGISLFLVPKFLVNADGTLGGRNDVICTKLEHKLGIHASPTCVMNFGEKGGAVGYLVGEPNRGLAAMFTMMIAARLSVGIQGVGIAERAYQQALAYARDRRQGASAKAPDGLVAIIEHPDVLRMLLNMKAKIAAARAIVLTAGAAMDVSHRSQDDAERERAGGIAALLTPVAKAYGTDIGVEVASKGIQVHGGMGYVEETGAAQHLRDARIATIYEGTNGIQAIDLVTRKLPLAKGAVVQGHIEDLRGIVGSIRASNEPSFGVMAVRLGEAVDALEEATRWMQNALGSSPNAALAVATPYTKLFAIATGGAYLAKGALAAVRSDNGARAHIAVARHFAEHLAVDAPSLKIAVTEGHATILQAAQDVFAA